MAKIEITKTELVWPGKYNEDGTRKEVPRVALPFQVIETVNESRATREATKMKGASLFDTYEGKEGDTFEAGWRNKLIWGNNLLVMGALLEKFAGKIDLIYIDPPFLKKEDFSIKVQLAEHTIEKEASIIEDKAWRDTWGRDHTSYLQMIYDRLVLAKDLLRDTGSIFVHIGPDVSHYVRMILEEVLGSAGFLNEVVWQRTDPHNDARSRFGNVHDNIYWFKRGERQYYDYNAVRDELSDSGETEYSLLELEEGGVVNWKGNESKKGRRFKLENATWKGIRKRFKWRGVTPSANREWIYDLDGMEQALKRGELYLRDPNKGSTRCWKKYLDENLGIVLQDIWQNTGRMKGGSEYPTQKPLRLLQQVILAASPKDGLVADFFAGSGTTCIAAESLGRRWIGCDLSRYAVHTARKQLLSVENCKPFEVLNLGRYERQYWQGVTFGEKKDQLTEQAIYEYLAFILKLYGAQPVAGLSFLHGKKGKAMVHIGAVDAPVTIAEIDAAVDECAKLKQGELHVLGWEWEMGLYDLMVEAAKKKSVKLLLLIIPREVMEQQAVAKGDVRFFELAYLAAEIAKPAKLTVQVKLKEFVIPNTELIPEEVRSEVKKWSDYIDYWAVDWEFQNDTFMQGWVAYRTRKDRRLVLESDKHTYEQPGKYRILVKVIDIFGNDTSQEVDVEVK